MGDRPVYIADGHHRYETACNLRDQIAAELAQRGETLAARAPGQLRADDARLDERPRHVGAGHAPLVPRPAADDSRSTARATGRLRSPPSRPAAARIARARCGRKSKLEGDQATLGLYTAADDQWTLARLTDAGRRRMAEVAADHSAEWQGLGVSILHRLVIETLLDAPQSACPQVRPRH